AVNGTGGTFTIFQSNGTNGNLVQVTGTLPTFASNFAVPLSSLLSVGTGINSTEFLYLAMYDFAFTPTEAQARLTFNPVPNAKPVPTQEVIVVINQNVSFNIPLDTSSEYMYDDDGDAITSYRTFGYTGLGTIGLVPGLCSANSTCLRFTPSSGYDFSIESVND